MKKNHCYSRAEETLSVQDWSGLCYMGELWMAAQCPTAADSSETCENVNLIHK